jgi:hypothetical protein
VNGDGLDDVIVGAWTYANVEFDEGAALVFHGSSSVTSAAAEASVPGGFALEAAVPNPTSGATELRYALPAAGRARLGLFDATGRLVGLVFEGERGPGRHSVQWDGRGAGGARLAPGVYFTRLEQGGRSSAAKVVLVR